MNTIILISAALAIGIAVGILIGTGLTTHSADRSLRLLAQRRRQLNVRNRTTGHPSRNPLGRGGPAARATTDRPGVSERTSPGAVPAR